MRSRARLHRELNLRRRNAILLMLAALVALLFAVTPARADRQCTDLGLLGTTKYRVCVPCWYKICDLLPPPASQ